MSWNQSTQGNSSIPAPSQNRKGGHTTAIDTQDSSASSPALPIDRMTDSDREPAFGRRGGWNCDSAKSPFARDNSIHRIQKRTRISQIPESSKQSPLLFLHQAVVIINVRAYGQHNENDEGGDLDGKTQSHAPFNRLHLNQSMPFKWRSFIHSSSQTRSPITPSPPHPFSIPMIPFRHDPRVKHDSGNSPDFSLFSLSSISRIQEVLGAFIVRDAVAFVIV